MVAQLSTATPHCRAESLARTMIAMPTPTTSREVRLAARPTGWPTTENFTVATVDLPELQDGEVLVRNAVMSVDPYMRGRMDDHPSYVPPFQVGAALDGGAVGEVVVSKSDNVATGTQVLHGFGWREYAVLPAKRVQPIDTAVAPASAYLGVLGMPGFTAYVGLTEIAAMKEGDAVFVSGAAGAVGSLVGQIARRRGASRVIGSAGSADKVRHLVDDLGFDAAFNYKDGNVGKQLREAAPDGIDVYFDNVGGDHLEAAIGSLNTFGRPVIFSSHQLDLVERLCHRVGIVVRGHMQECGSVDQLRARGGTQLAVHAPQAPPGWADELPGVYTVRHDHTRTVLALGPDADDQVVLAAALRTGPVHEFARSRPTLTELFREVVAA